VVTSGPAYRASCTSYMSCAVTVPTVTAPPVPGCFVITLDPSAEISAIGLRSRYNERADFLITTTPPLTETDVATSADRVLPHLVNGGGYTTQFIFLSGSPGRASSGSLLLLQNSGQPFGLTLE